MRFHKNFSAKHAFITLIKKMTKEDNGGSFGALVTNLSKAFECLPHEHVIAELDGHVYEVS